MDKVSIINKISLKFVLGFLGILFMAMVVLVVTSYFDQEGVDEVPVDANVANNQV